MTLILHVVKTQQTVFYIFMIITNYHKLFALMLFTNTA